MTYDPTLPPGEVLRALRRRRSVRAWRANDPSAWQPRFRASFIDDDDEDDGPVAPRGDHAPPPDLVEAMQDCNLQVAPGGGTVRIIHRTSYAALDETVRRIARQKAKTRKV
jgi:hypothetical protein